MGIGFSDEKIEEYEQAGHRRDKERIAELEAELAAANAALESKERRHSIEIELLGAGCVDRETGFLLVDAMLSENGGMDIGVAVSELRSRKPFLFPIGTATPARTGKAGMEQMERLASSARSSGDRNELLRYLRARRQA